MLSLQKLAPGTAAVVAALLLGLAPRPTKATSSDGVIQEQQSPGATRLAELAIPFVSEILRSSSPEDLEARLEAQLATGLFADWVRTSLDVMQHDTLSELHQLEAGEISLEDVIKDFVLRTPAGDQSKVREALRLSLISSQLGYRLARRAADELDVDVMLEAAIESMDEFFYDTQVPLEVRRAVYDGAESALCMVSVAHAVREGMELPPWLAECLVDRWLGGQRASLSLFAPLARELGLELEDLGVSHDVRELDLETLRARADLLAEADATIVEHAKRQPSGSWPPVEGS